MRVLIDARVIQDHFPGIGRYVFNLIKALAPQLDGTLLVLLDANAVNSRYDLTPLARHDNVQFVTTNAPVFHWRSQIALPRLIHRLQPDVVHFAYNVRPLKLATPTVLTLYDIIPRRFPQYFSLPSRWKIEGIQRAALRSSQRFVAISQNTAQDFNQFYNVPESLISVTPLAPDPIFRPRPQAELTAFRQMKNLPARYFLYLGSNKPHKNLPRLIRAWAQVPELKMGDLQLLIAGHWDERYPQARALAERLGIMERVQFLGSVPSAELPLLYAAAQAFVFPSLYEGFGLPVLEAMASGVPVACSQAPGLSEVAGQAALSFDPVSVEAMADALFWLGTDAEVRAHLTRLGRERALAFSWEKTAQLTLATYAQAMG